MSRLRCEAISKFVECGMLQDYFNLLNTLGDPATGCYTTPLCGHQHWCGTRIILEHTIGIVLEHNRGTTDKDHSGTQMIPIRIILEHRQSFGGLFGWGGGLGWGGAITFTRTSNYLLADMGWVGGGGATTFTRNPKKLIV